MSFIKRLSNVVKGSVLSSTRSRGDGQLSEQELAAELQRKPPSRAANEELSRRKRQVAATQTTPIQEQDSGSDADSLARLEAAFTRGEIDQQTYEDRRQALMEYTGRTPPKRTL